MTYGETFTSCSLLTPPGNASTPLSIMKAIYYPSLFQFCPTTGDVSPHISTRFHNRFRPTTISQFFWELWRPGGEELSNAEEKKTFGLSIVCLFPTCWQAHAQVISKVTPTATITTGKHREEPQQTKKNTILVLVCAFVGLAGAITSLMLDCPHCCLARNKRHHYFPQTPEPTVSAI